MLRLLHGNRLEPLAARLMDSLLRSPASPFQPEIIIVPSLGIARWLQYRIADVFSVCARVEFPYPAQFIWQSFARILAGAPTRSPFDSNVIQLRLFALLGKLPRDSDMAPIHAYLDRTGTRGRFDLSQQLARTFDQYLIYRPDWLASWQEGRNCGLRPASTERWQSRLWRRLVDDAGLSDLQNPSEIALARLLSDPGLASRVLPDRIRLFGLTSLPPQYASVLARLGRHVEVEWYLPNPCRQYWADIVSERTQAQLALQFDGAQSREVGHPLLASWGHQARDLIAIALDQSDVQSSSDESCFVTPKGPQLLARLQRSILDLSPLSDSPVALQAQDSSVQIHACHSLIRQLEVLHNNLLGLFNCDPTLRPSDIVVMVPDPEKAAPMIEAVFGAAPLDRQIAYNVTGLAAASASPYLRAFAGLIDLPRSRFVAAEVLDFVQLPAISAHYEMTESDIEQLRTWLSETGVRWGRDGPHRRELGLPAEPRNTMVDGLLQLLFGFAMPATDDTLVAGVMPYADIEGSQSVTLGKFARLLGDVVALKDHWVRARPVSEWCDTFLNVVSDCLVTDEISEFDDRRLRDVISGLRQDAEIAALDEPVDVDFVRQLIDERLLSVSPGGVPGGGVTFTGIGPLRGLPYRVVCLLGLDSGAFPRNPGTTEFDLIAQHPRRGDRARRLDDRGAFLDALLAARDVFWIGYCGHSIRDNSHLPPSVLVLELIDYLGRFTAGGRDEVSRILVTEHPLQPFDVRCFRPGPQQSFASEYLAAAHAMQQGPQPFDETRDALFEGHRLEDLADLQWKQVTVNGLCAFLRNPLRYLLRERVGVRFDEADVQLPPDEPLALPEAKWKLREHILKLALDGQSVPAIVTLLGASSLIPHGRWGRRLLEAEVRPAVDFAVEVLRIRGVPVPARPFDLQIGDFCLSGTLDGLTDSGRFVASYRDISALDWLDAWPRHLVLQLLDADGPMSGTRILSRSGLRGYAPVQDAKTRLAELLELYWEGMHAPLSFLPKSALELLDKDARRALDVWIGNAHIRGESQEPYSRLRFRRGRRRFPDGFEAEAERVLAPLLAARMLL